MEPTTVRRRRRTAQQHRFGWRRQLARRPVLDLVYRGGVAVVGLAVVVLGIVLLPLPGPGWLIIFAGIGVWATEFAWARRLLRWTRAQVAAWTRWLQHRARWLQGLVTLAVIVLVLLILWTVFAIVGLPGLTPGWVRDLLAPVPGL